MQNNGVINRTLTLLELLSNPAKCDIKSRLYTKASNTEQVFKGKFFDPGVVWELSKASHLGNAIVATEKMSGSTRTFLFFSPPTPC